MNHTYRSITGFVLKAPAGLLLLAFGSTSYALPVGGEVVAGSATVNSGNGAMTITQASQNVTLNWQSFNIGAAEAVRFVQPNSSSVALNRVIGSDPSHILGSLTANGKVFLVNPNGILFGKGASVNVGGLVASTRNISDSEFMAGNYTFAGTGGGDILNQGIINADGGYVALLSAHVSNEGTISARLGTVALAAGNGLTLDVVGDGLLNVAVNEAAVNALVQNGGMIQADGGHVLMTAQAAGSLLSTVVNNTGVIQARTIENRDGVIKLLGDMQSGTINVAGTLDASAPNGGNGGFIETSAAHVKVSDDARITTLALGGSTGNWLIDPADFIIAAGGGASTSSSIGADTLSSALNNSNVRIETVGYGSENGDIHVNSAVSWNENELTLNAHGDININADLNGSDMAKLALEYGQATVDGAGSGYALRGAQVNLAAGNNFSTKLGSGGNTVRYMVITGLGDAGDTNTMSLQGINGDLAGNYVLGANIDASATNGWNGGAGFDPIGNKDSRFIGTFDGLGHTISGLVIKRTTDYVGLFGHTGNGSAIRNLGLVGGSVAGKGYAGGLVGKNESGTITQVYTTGTVSASGSFVGGLVGLNSSGTISRSYATGAVRSTTRGIVGGLVGQNSQSTISQSYATGAVSGTANVGGLVGTNFHSQIDHTYATGAVSGNSSVGGLVGQNDDGTLTQSYAIGAVSGTTMVGGLVGYNPRGSITQTYATGTVTDKGTAGSHFGGLVGKRDGGTLTHSYWATDTTGRSSSAGGGTGLTTTQMMQLTSFSSWNDATPHTIANTGGGGAVWRIYEGHTAPLLTSFMTGLTLTGAPDLAVTYNGNVQSGSSITKPSGVLGGAATGTNAGFYNGYYSTQQGYDIIGGNLNISKADLTISTSDVSKTYDGALTAIGLATLTSGTLFGNDSISGGTFSFTDKNAGSGNKTVTATGVTVDADNSGGNYNVTYVDNTTSTIVPKALTVAGVTALDKVYDGNTTATLVGGTLTGMISDDTVTLIEAGTFATPNAGNGIAVAAALSLGGSSAGNYTVTQPTGLTANISAPERVVDANLPDQNAIISAVSVMSAMPLQGNMANAQLPSPQDAIDASMPSRLAELNLTITGDGVRMRSMVETSDARDDEN